MQLALLTATVKLFIKRPTAGQELVPKVLKWATEEVDNPDLRDRGYIYWRLLSTDPSSASTIVFSDKPPISTESEAMDRGVLDRLLLHTGTLASLYGKEPQTFIRGARGKRLIDSACLDPAAKVSFMDSLGLPVHVQPTSIVSTTTLISTAPSTTIGLTPGSPAAPAVPPKPYRANSAISVSNGNGDATGSGLANDGEFIVADEEEGDRSRTRETDEEEDDDEAEGLALNPAAPPSLPSRPAVTATPSTLTYPEEPIDDPNDPYAALSRLSAAGFGGNGILDDGNSYGMGSSLGGWNAEARGGKQLDSSLL